MAGRVVGQVRLEMIQVASSVKGAWTDTAGETLTKTGHYEGQYRRESYVTNQGPPLGYNLVISLAQSISPWPPQPAMELGVMQGLQPCQTSTLPMPQSINTQDAALKSDATPLPQQLLPQGSEAPNAFCIHCGAQSIPPGANFCSACGQPQS